MTFLLSILVVLQVLKWEITEILMSLAEVVFSEFDIFFRFILWLVFVFEISVFRLFNFFAAIKITLL